MDNRVESIEKRESFIICVGKFSLGNRMYYYLIREHLRRTEKRWTLAMSAKGK